MPLISFSGITKSFEGVLALNDVSLNILHGEVHALMGENGAGKSTLIKIISGFLKPDEANFKINQSSINIKSVSDSRKIGFKVIHQELNFIPQISVAENIMIGEQYPKIFGTFINWQKLYKKSKRALAELGVGHINVRTPMESLQAGDKMLVKIASALVDNETSSPSLLILDEPTAALNDAECEKLFFVIDKLKKKGCSILYVSHRIEEILQHCNRITVLKDGKNAGTFDASNTTKKMLVSAMTGRDVPLSKPEKREEDKSKKLIMIQDIKSKNLEDINFDLHEGEILGVFGLANSGQSQLLNLFMGKEKIFHGQISLSFAPLPKNPHEAWKNQISYIPKERRQEALMLKGSIRENILLPNLNQYGFFPKRRREIKDSIEICKKVSLKYLEMNQPIYQLSGGNQQKAVFARATLKMPKLLLLDEPTRGVDIGAKFELHQLIRSVTINGSGIIIASSDIPELLGLCDRIVILTNGKQKRIVTNHNLNARQLLQFCYD